MSKSAPHPPRVNHDRLDFDDDLALLDGTPFTGLVYSEYPDGTNELQHRYLEGLPEGLQESWYPNGQLFERWIAIRGKGASESSTWYRNGIQRSYRRYKDGQMTEARAWDEEGRAIDPASLPPDNAVSTLIDLFR